RVLIAIASNASEEILVTQWPISYWRAEALKAIAPYRPNDVLLAARKIEDEAIRTQVLTALAHLIPMEVLPVARELHDDGIRTDLLATIATQLQSIELWEEVLESAMHLRCERQRVTALVNAAPYLSKATYE